MRGPVSLINEKETTKRSSAIPELDEGAQLLLTVLALPSPYKLLSGLICAIGRDSSLGQLQEYFPFHLKLCSPHRAYLTLADSFPWSYENRSMSRCLGALPPPEWLLQRYLLSKPLMMTVS